MSSRIPFAAAGSAALLWCGGCACTPGVTVPDVPASLRPPTGHIAFLEALASGVQVYECAPKADGTGVHEWAFRSPEATLTYRSGRPLGKHFAGPTWAANDGSTVVAQVKARDAAPSASAIPWLLLSATSTSGNGIFGQTMSIQRVHTAGGVAPAASCGPTNGGQTERVPYTATYYFYRAAR